jgi:hypothetical protein
MKEEQAYLCPVTATLSVIGGLWKPIILFALQKGSKRFGGDYSGDKQKNINGTTERTGTAGDDHAN